MHACKQARAHTHTHKNTHFMGKLDPEKLSLNIIFEILLNELTRLTRPDMQRLVVMDTPGKWICYLH